MYENLQQPSHLHFFSSGTKGKSVYLRLCSSVFPSICVPNAPSGTGKVLLFLPTVSFYYNLITIWLLKKTF